MDFDEIIRAADEGGLIQDAIEALDDLVRGAGETAKADVRGIGARIMRNLVKAKIAGDVEWEDALLGQARALGEVQRLRAVAVTNEALEVALQTAASLAMRIATRLASGGLAG